MLLAVVALVASGIAINVAQVEVEEPVARSNVACYTEQGGAKVVAGSGCEWELQSGATFDAQSGVTFSIPGGYPLAYASSGYEIVCGTTGVFTATTDVGVTSLTTVTQGIVTQITDPAATGSIVTVDAVSGITLTVNSWESDFTAGTTGVDVYYCALGNQ